MKDSLVVITPARNEARFLPGLIQSMLSQTLRPLAWLVVDDGSQDETGRIVAGYAAVHPFVRLMALNHANQRTFASKVQAIDAAWSVIRDTEFSFLGIIDADLTFQPDYFERLLAYFAAHPGLGVAGGHIQELIGREYAPTDNSLNHVADGVQTYRRECYEAIGGLRALPSGGEGGVAEFMARMKGWGVETLTTLQVCHHRRVGTTRGSVLRGRYNDGCRDYLIGYDPLFYVMKCVYRLRSQPRVIGGLLSFIGYAWHAVQRKPRLVPNDFTAALRSEQRARLRAALTQGRFQNRIGCNG